MCWQHMLSEAHKHARDLAKDAENLHNQNAVWWGACRNPGKRVHQASERGFFGTRDLSRLWESLGRDSLRRLQGIRWLQIA